MNIDQETHRGYQDEEKPAGLQDMNSDQETHQGYQDEEMPAGLQGHEQRSRDTSGVPGTKRCRLDYRDMNSDQETHQGLQDEEMPIIPRVRPDSR